ncbi:hypothetical protein DV737_g4506, partial [Chaetothyriales sp. CBS 132003]
MKEAPQSNFDVDYVVKYQVDADDKDGSIEQFKKLVRALAQVGLTTEVRRGDDKSLLVFTKASDESILSDVVYRSRVKDFLYGLRQVQPAKDAPGAASSALRDGERLRYVHWMIVAPVEEGGAGITPKHGEWKNVDSIFPLHDHVKNKKWLAELSTKTFLTSEDLDEIRDKVGEKIAYYYAFLQSYFSFMIFPAAFGFSCWVLVGSFSWIYGIAITLWSVVFVEYWKRQEQELAIRWGVKNVSVIQQRRRGFEPEKTIIDDVTGEQVPFFPAKTRVQRQLLQIPLTLLSIVALGSIICLSYVIEIFISEVYHGPFKSILTFTPTILLTLAVPTTSNYLTGFAQKLSLYENYETQDAYDKAVVSKVFVINFLTSYTAILLTSFVYVPFASILVPYLDILSLTTAAGAASFTINPNRLKNQMIYFAVTAQVVNFAMETIVPWFTRKGQDKFKQFRSSRAEKNGGGQPAVADSDPAEEREFLHRVREEASLPEYDVDSDLREMAIQFGYLALFSVIWPLTPLTFFVNNWVELRGDIFKLTVECKRPSPQRADSIGPWLRSLEFLAWLGSITTAALVYMFSGSSDGLGPDGRPHAIKAWGLLLSILLSEHIFLVVRVLVRTIIGSLDSASLRKERSERFMVRKKYLDDAGLGGDAARPQSPASPPPAANAFSDAKAGDVLAEITRQSLEEDARQESVHDSSPSSRFWAHQRSWRETEKVGLDLIDSLDPIVPAPGLACHTHNLFEPSKIPSAVQPSANRALGLSRQRAWSARFTPVKQSWKHAWVVSQQPGTSASQHESDDETAPQPTATRSASTMKRLEAAYVEFGNCLDSSIVNSEPRLLQFVPLNVSARFDQSTDSHNLNVTVWGNVTGQATEQQYPLPDDASWSDPNSTFGKIVDISQANNKYTTLFADFSVLSYNPYVAQPARFCASLINGQCPLAPSFYVNATDLARLPAFSVAHDMLSTYAFASITATMRIQSGDSSGQYYSCVSAAITPDLGPTLNDLLRYLPLAILLIVAVATVSASVLSPWGSSDILHWSSNFGRDDDVLRLVTPGFGDCLQYIQFVLLSGSLTLNYPGFFQPVVSRVAWSALMFNESFVTRGNGFQPVVDGVYSYGNSSRYGLDRISRLVGMTDQKDVWAGMMVWLAVIVAGVAVLTQLGFVPRLLYQQLVARHGLPQDLRSKNGPFTAGNIVRVCMNYFLLPLVSLSFFQLAIAGRGPAYAVALAVVALIAVLGFAARLLFLFIRVRPRSFLFDDLLTLLAYGPLYNTYCDDAATFALVPILVNSLRGIAIGALSQSGIAQVVLLAVCEIILILTLNAFRPYPSATSMNIYHTCFSLIRLITILLCIAFVPSLQVADSSRGWIGYAILLIHACVLVFGFFLNAVQTLIEVIARLAGAGAHRDVEGGAARGGLTKVFGMRQLSRRMPRHGHQPSRNSIASNAAMLAAVDIDPSLQMAKARSRSISASSTMLLDGPARNAERMSQNFDGLSGGRSTPDASSTVSRQPAAARVSRASGDIVGLHKVQSRDPYFRQPRRNTVDAFAPGRFSTDLASAEAATSAENAVDDDDPVEDDFEDGASDAGQKPKKDYAVREVDFYYRVRGPALSSGTRKRKTGPADPTGPVSSATGWFKSLIGGKTKEKHKGFEVVRSARAPPELFSPTSPMDDDLQQEPYRDDPASPASASHDRIRSTHTTSPVPHDQTRHTTSPVPHGQNPHTDHHRDSPFLDDEEPTAAKMPVLPPSLPVIDSVGGIELPVRQAAADPGARQSRMHSPSAPKDAPPPVPPVPRRSSRRNSSQDHASASRQRLSTVQGSTSSQRNSDAAADLANLSPPTYGRDMQQQQQSSSSTTLADHIAADRPSSMGFVQQHRASDHIHHSPDAPEFEGSTVQVFGYDTGQISGFLEMPNFLDRFGQTNSRGERYFSDVRSGLIVALLSIGTLIGALVGAPIADKIGRRPSISICCVVVSVGFIIQIAADTAWYQVMIGRFIAGLGVGGLSLMVPMYQAETAPPWIRGAMISSYQLFITLGIFLAACFNFGTYEHQRANSGSWRIVLGLGWIWTTILGVGILFLPETPRYVYRQGRVQEAKETMIKVYGAPPNHYSVYNEMEEIEAKLRADSQVKGSAIQEIVSMLNAPRMPYRIILGVVLQALQQLTGANYFFYYGTTIFKSVGINNSYVTQMILNGINFGSTFIGLFLVERYGRRKSLIAGAMWMFVCFIIFASVGHFSLDRQNPTRTQGAGTALIVFACFFILGFATTWGPMVWAIIAEMFPGRYRAKGMALSTASNWTWNFLIAFFTPFITKAIDFRYGYVFAGCNLLAGFVVYFFVMEGQGRTLEELDTMFIERVAPWKSSKWEAPTEAEMSRIRKEAGTDHFGLADSDEDKAGAEAAYPPTTHHQEHT